MEQRTERRKDRIEGFPRGWFVIGFSNEYQPGDVKSMTYFGHRLVCFRGQSGDLHVIDAYCPHLGMDLGKGKVIEDTLECPFHSWRFNGQGECTEIPYCQDIPKRAASGSWTTTWLLQEKNGVIFLWFDPEGKAPDFEIPLLPESESEEWTYWEHSKIHIKTHSREIVENVVDIAHFAPVHGTIIEEFSNDFNEHKAIQYNKGVAYPRGGGKDYFDLTATYYGPGFQISVMNGFLESRLINAHTMVDANSLDLRFGVMLKKGTDPKQTESFSKGYIDNLTTGFLEDIEIWENKCYRDVPLLCGDDGPVMKLRKWYKQFYSEASTAPTSNRAPA
ncbi:3-ketosteroid-9-alpha-monooxygenase, oxygenase component-like [Ylistrum balloti]|uniref:3-ketosteroid-9-alpha-monooxygenase, oxygenase component-like n=1 Tax=Ylistrum balloti TaxID=509963 RepID=UPI002905B087|nr:3-ketosteroid-9-alpha-monooxygenase, oxygenase component-like [Ylistrum balloti]